MKQQRKKEYLIGIGIIIVFCVFLFIGNKYEFYYLRTLGYFLLPIAGIYIAPQYFGVINPNIKPKAIILSIVFFLLMAALITWILDGRLW